MKVIFDAFGIKREITGPFRLCASEKDLRAIRRQIDVALETNMTYGWVDIVDPPPPAVPNQPPIPWDQ